MDIHASKVAPAPVNMEEIAGICLSDDPQALAYKVLTDILQMRCIDDGHEL